MNYVRANYAGTVDELSPASFDPKSEDVTDWVAVFCETISEPPTRRHDKKRTNVRVICHCWSQTTDTVRPEKKQAELIAELFRHAVISVIDYGQVGNPTVGTLTFWEPTVTDERDTGEGVDDGYSLAMVKVSGVAQEA